MFARRQQTHTRGAKRQAASRPAAAPRAARGRAGFTLAELLLTVGILVILFALVAINVVQWQKNLRQTELDGKAEVVYTAVQNALSKKMAAGATSCYDPDLSESNGVAPFPNAEDIPSDADPDVDLIKPGDIYYFTSNDKDSQGHAAYVLVDDNTIDGNAHWVVEFDPASATVYSVFYSENLANCATGYAYDAFGEYNTSLRYRDNRLKDGARVGYYGGGSANSGDVTKITPRITVINAEKLVANLSVSVPSSAGTSSPVFEVTLKDAEGNTYIQYFTYGQPTVEGNTKNYPVNSASMTKLGRTYSVALTLDDLSEEATRFVNQYGSKATITGDGNNALDAGTELTITLKVSVPSDWKLDSGTADESITNSLFADKSTANAAYVSCVRHLQNLDNSSGVTDAITTAVQTDNLSFVASADKEGLWDWAETYCGAGSEKAAYFNGLSEGKANFKPISNSHLGSTNPNTFYDGGDHIIKNFFTDASVKGDEYTGLFASAYGNIKDLTMTGTRVLAGASTKAAAALVGHATRNVGINNVQVYLAAEDINGIPGAAADKYQYTWIGDNGSSSLNVGGLIGEVTGGTVSIFRSSAAATVGAFNNSANTAGGLVGNVTGGIVEISESFADCYLRGTRAGGLVGVAPIASSVSTVDDTSTMANASSAVRIQNSYAAGFITSTDAGAGMVNGGAWVKNSYTILGFLNNGTSTYQAVTASDEVQNRTVFYLTQAANGGKKQGTSITSDTMTNVLSTLGSGFRMKSSPGPYNLMGQTLTAYTYPETAALAHHGDWAADFQSGALVYYETYDNNTVGFYGGNVDSSLRSDNGVKATGDGYGLVYRLNSTNLPDSVEVIIPDINTSETLGISGVTPAYTKQVGDYTYGIYPLSTATVNAATTSGEFYMRATLNTISGGQTIDTACYDFNPYFAHTQVGPVDADRPRTQITTDNNTIAVRTARHTYDLSIYYDQYAGATAVATFLQGRDIDYATYNWDGFSLAGSSVSSQDPIAGGKTPFQAIYDGQCHWIQNVSFISRDGNYIGMFGRNQGTIQNVVLLAAYDPDKATNYYVQRKQNLTGETVYMGILVGLNERTESQTGRISNCAVSGYYVAGSDATLHAYSNSTLYVGGLVGQNAGVVSTSTADCPAIRLSALYANVAIGGLVGRNTAAGTIDHCYDLGYIEVAESKGGSVAISGFAGVNAGVISNSYCATALTASGETAVAYGFAPRGGLTSDSGYLNKGTYTYVGQMHAFDFTSPAGTSRTYSWLRDTADNDGVKPDISYDFNLSTDDQYPFPAVVTNRAGQLVHYGDWLENKALGTMGVFYWEHEEYGTNNGYHLTFIGTDGGDSAGGTSLCTAHDDGGIVTEYGYGYYYQDEGSVEITSNSGIAYSGDTFNTTASDALHEQMDGYYFHAYTTRTAAEARKADYICLTGDGNQNGTLTLTYTANTSGIGTDYTYTVSPFFANAMSTLGGPTLTASDGTSTDYSVTPGKADNKYEIRSATQLQYLNWNSKENTTSEWLNYADYVSNGNKVPDKWSAFTYLGYVPGKTSGSQAKYYFNQTHDTNADMAVNSGTTAAGSEFTPIGSFCELNPNNNATVAAAYFNGTYNGNNYQIKNVEICSRSQGVGLFGITISADIQNIILYSDKGNKIQTSSDSKYASDGTGNRNWYCMGGLAGVAAIGNSSTGGSAVFKNCTVSGYVIRDNRNDCGYGGTNMGGFVGLTNVGISACSAATDIQVQPNYSNSSRNIRVGGLAGNFRGATLENCYSGGSISSTTANSTSIHVGGLVGGWFMRTNGNLPNTSNGLFGALTAKPTVSNCYTYADLSGCTGSSVKTICPVVSNCNNENTNNNFTVSNCYYYPPKTVAYKQRTVDNNNTLAIPVTYDQLAGTANLTSGSYSGRDILTALNVGAAAASGAWDWVTKVDNAGVAIDGKYSFPAGNAALEGKNYPFPTVVRQKDLTFSTVDSPVMVNVHYGDWPIDGPYWEDGRTTLDIFDDMHVDGWAKQTFYLNPNGKTIDLELADIKVDDSSKAEVESVTWNADTGLWEVVVRAKNVGVTDLTASGKLSDGTDWSSVFTLEITANITVEADPSAPIIADGASQDVALTAKSANDTAYETNRNTTWKVSVLDPDLADLLDLTQKDERDNKNVWNVKREGNGEVQVRATFSYKYNDVTIESDCFIEVLQPDAVGLSNGTTYNAADLVDAGNVAGKGTSYAVDIPKPTAEGWDYFLYLSQGQDKANHFADYKVNSVTASAGLLGPTETYTAATGATDTTNVYDQGNDDGFHIELAKDATHDDLYEYLTGTIYYRSTSSNASEMSVDLTFELQKDTSVYTLTIPLSVRVVKPVTVTYQVDDTSGAIGDNIVRSAFSGSYTLITGAELGSWTFPSGQCLAGWVKRGGDGTVYQPGETVQIDGDTTFTPTWKNLAATFYGNGALINGQETYEYVFDQWTPSVSLATVTDMMTAPEGYTLSGWNTAADGRGTSFKNYDYVAASSLAPGYALYAQWTPKTYTIALQSEEVSPWYVRMQNAATYDSPVLDASSYTNHFTRAGYKLVGFADAKENGVMVLSVGDDGSLGYIPGVAGYTNANGCWVHDSDCNLYTQWEPVNYELSFKGNAPNDTATVDGVPETQTIGETGTFSGITDPTCEGYKFAGWATSSTGDVAYSSADLNGKTPSQLADWSTDSTMTLYARWYKTQNAFVDVTSGGLVAGQMYYLSNNNDVDTVGTLLGHANDAVSSSYVTYAAVNGVKRASDGSDVTNAVLVTGNISDCEWTVLGSGDNRQISYRDANDTTRYLSYNGSSMINATTACNWRLAKGYKLRNYSFMINSTNPYLWRDDTIGWYLSDTSNGSATITLYQLVEVYDPNTLV
ncbi:MAG: hypothetical protein Q4E12_02125 [Coriobacteriia bacterium]|nr:hypothetical protein [Coriobacteriia bacterium]